MLNVKLQRESCPLSPRNRLIRAEAFSFFDLTH
jgi:hypothetical protein